MKLNTNRSKGNNRRTMESNWKNKNHQPQQPTTTNKNEHNSPKSMHENGGNYNNEPQLQDATTVQQPWHYCGKWWCNHGKWWPTTTTKHNCNHNTQWPQQPWCNNDASTGNDHANTGRWWCKCWKWCCNRNNQPQPQDTTTTQLPEMMTQLWERRQMRQPTTTSW